MNRVLFLLPFKPLSFWPFKHNLCSIEFTIFPENSDNAPAILQNNSNHIIFINNVLFEKYYFIRLNLNLKDFQKDGSFRGLNYLFTFKI